MYMGCAGLERALFVVMCKNDCAVYTERVHFRKTEFEALVQKAQEIIGAEVEIKAYAKDSRECGMCDYRMHCWHAPYIQEAPTCGTCFHCAFHGIAPYCRKHDHDILKWGAACPDWQFLDASLDVVPF